MYAKPWANLGKACLIPSGIEAKINDFLLVILLR
jgi:hypothetical protein